MNFLVPMLIILVMISGCVQPDTTSTSIAVGAPQALSSYIADAFSREVAIRMYDLRDWLWIQDNGQVITK